MRVAVLAESQSDHHEGGGGGESQTRRCPLTGQQTPSSTVSLRPPARGPPARQLADMDDDEGVAFEGETIKPLVERVRCPPLSGIRAGAASQLRPAATPFRRSCKRRLHPITSGTPSRRTCNPS